MSETQEQSIAMSVVETAAGIAILLLSASTGILLIVAVTSGPRIEAVGGRLREVTQPVRGPLDFAISRILEEVPDPSGLVIATNYANHPLMFYLGSHVIVGTNLNNIVADRQL